MKHENGAPPLVDSEHFQAELDALRVREKAHTREGDASKLRPRAGGCRWSSLGPRRSMASVVRSHYWTPLMDAATSLPIASCSGPANLRRSSARAAPGLRRRFASCPTFMLATSPTPRFGKAHSRRAPAKAAEAGGRPKFDILFTCPGRLFPKITYSSYKDSR
jgi:hypothetical protein